MEPSGPLQACNGTALPFYLNECGVRLRGTSSCVMHNRLFKTKKSKSDSQNKMKVKGDLLILAGLPSIIFMFIGPCIIVTVEE